MAVVALGLLTSPRKFSSYLPRGQRVSAFNLLIVKCEVRNKISVEQEKVCSTRFLVISLRKVLETFIGFFFPL